MNRFKLSNRGFHLITEFESLQLKAYLDPAGIPTIGYGTTKLNGFPVALGMVINEPVAVALLYGHCNTLLKELEKYIINGLIQNQVDALCSLVYNIGMGAFEHSTLLSKINKKESITEDLFTRWNKIRNEDGSLKELPGLTRRRKKEFDLFVNKDI